MCRLIDEQRPVARTQHGCNACGLPHIGPGDSYVRQWVADYGDAWTWRAHPPWRAHPLCLAALDVLRREDGGWFECEDPDWDDVRSYVGAVLNGVCLSPQAVLL